MFWSMKCNTHAEMWINHKYLIILATSQKTHTSSFFNTTRSLPCWKLKKFTNFCSNYFSCISKSLMPLCVFPICLFWTLYKWNHASGILLCFIIFMLVTFILSSAAPPTLPHTLFPSAAEYYIEWAYRIPVFTLSSVGVCAVFSSVLPGTLLVWAPTAHALTHVYIRESVP